MTDFDTPRNLPEAPFSTNAYAIIDGVKHQITARGSSATEMTSNYFAAVDTLTAAYTARSRRMDPAQLLALVQCGIAKAVKHNDLDRIKRLMKAVEIVQSGGVTAEQDGTYAVTSQSDPAKGYWVNADGACACEDWIRHAEQKEVFFCKHSLAVLLVIRLQAYSASTIG